MNYTFFDFLQLIGSLGIFIFGMKVFSEALQKVAGHRLRTILKKMTSNRLAGIVSGFSVTAITQSSTTTTVMVVSFVNAGLLTFAESIGVIMGANIGTTITAWMVSIFGFKVSITPIAIALIGIFFPFLFVPHSKLKQGAEAIIGFGILFIGLEFIKGAMPDIQNNPEMLSFVQNLTGFGFGSILLFVLAGTLLTLLTQSSSASTTITLVMLAQGWIEFEIAAAMILGENIGTTVTANIAALVGNVHAKRAARFHFLFNVIGVLWMLLVFNYFLTILDYILSIANPFHVSLFLDDPESRLNATLGLSLFHTLFNITNVILLLALVPLLAKMVERLLPVKAASDEEFRLKYIERGIMPSVELSLVEAQREVQAFARIVKKMFLSFRALLFENAPAPQMLAKIKKREEITDNIELEIADYLTEVSAKNLSFEASLRVRGMLSIINDLERIADVIFQISKTYERMLESEFSLAEGPTEELKEMVSAIYRGIEKMRENLGKDPGQINLKEAYQMEKEIDEIRDRYRRLHFERLEQKAYPTKSGFFYIEFLNRLERIGDHLLNINEAAAGKK
jgi:phosphate:Na+ symporter